MLLTVAEGVSVSHYLDNEESVASVGLIVKGGHRSLVHSHAGRL